jgi:hypothetical protein
MQTLILVIRLWPGVDEISNHRQDARALTTVTWRRFIWACPTWNRDESY